MKGHPEQNDSVEQLRTILSEKTYNYASDRSRQEPYSLRGAPQIYGAIRKQITQARNTVIEEINGVDDNPVIDPDGERPTAFHGANFMSQNVAFAMDNLNQALTQIGNIIEKQLGILLDPNQNNGLDKMLTPEPGANSGLAGAQINATAILSEMRNNCQSQATSSLPTNGQNQDVVPMGLEAGKNAYQQTDRLSQLLAIMGMSLVQYDWLYEEKKTKIYPINRTGSRLWSRWKPIDRSVLKSSTLPSASATGQRFSKTWTHRTKSIASLISRGSTISISELFDSINSSSDN